jgi:hypothetical protein
MLIERDVFTTQYLLENRYSARQVCEILNLLSTLRAERESRKGE